MEPTFSPLPNHSPARALVSSRLFKWLIALLVLAGLAFVGWQIYLSTTLHVVKTDPELGSVAAISPYVKITFNEPVVKDSLSILTGPNVVGYSLNDKVVTVLLNQHLTIGQTYKITITSATSTSGKQLRGKVLSFTAKNIAYSDLSEDQQQGLVKNQDQYIYSVFSIKYVGFDALVDQGVTADQLLTLKYDLFGFSAIKNTEFRTMTIDTPTIRIVNHAASSADMNNYAYFNIKLGADTYQVTMTFSGLSAVQVLLKDAAGNVAYDSTAGHD